MVADMRATRTLLANRMKSLIGEVHRQAYCSLDEKEERKGFTAGFGGEERRVERLSI